MLLKPDKKNIPALIKLWQECFGDEDGYIKMFFEKEYFGCLTFADLNEGKIVSALYLLPADLDSKGKKLTGFYLYAAATKKSHRGEGRMAALIKEAERYCDKSGADFIALVPANERLYGYYQKFGFEKAMYKTVTEIELSADGGETAFVKTDASGYLEERRKLLNGGFEWDESELSYAFDCFSYYGISAYKGEGFCFIAEKGGLVPELLFTEQSKNKALSAAADACGGRKLTVYSKNDVSPLSKKIPFGMIRRKSEENGDIPPLTDIYMNIALD